MTLLLVLIYVAFRFRWRFGVGSLVASLHDPIVAVGAIALLGIPFDLNVVAALLTILGYSVNDTVVIFDRIRERFTTMRKAEPAEVIDRAINETLGAHDHRGRAARCPRSSSSRCSAARRCAASRSRSRSAS